MSEEYVQESAVLHHSFGHQSIKSICKHHFGAKDMAEIGFCASVNLSVFNFPNGKLIEASNSYARVMRSSLLTCNVCLVSSCLLCINLHLSAGRKVTREADEDILCSMKDGGRHSHRPQWWNYIDPATLEPQVQGFWLCQHCSAQHSQKPRSKNPDKRK